MGKTDFFAGNLKKGAFFPPPPLPWNEKSGRMLFIERTFRMGPGNGRARTWSGVCASSHKCRLSCVQDPFWRSFLFWKAVGSCKIDKLYRLCWGPSIFFHESGIKSVFRSWQSPLFSGTLYRISFVLACFGRDPPNVSRRQRDGNFCLEFKLSWSLRSSRSSFSRFILYFGKRQTPAF